VIKETDVPAHGNPERDPMFRGLVVLMAVGMIVALAFDGFNRRARGATPTIAAASPAATKQTSSEPIAVTLTEFLIEPNAIPAKGWPATAPLTGSSGRSC
jgi:hypothetical protein